MRHPQPLIASVLLAMAIAACSAGGTPAPASGGPASGTPAGLDGRTFLATAITGRALVAGTTVRISFTSGVIGASAGCNSMSGPYVIDGDVLRTGQLATTEMGCEPALMAQDQWLAGMLDGAGIVLAGDTLTLTKAGVTLTLRDREVVDPDRPLTGTRWVLDGIVSGETVSSVPAGVVAALTFSDGRVAVEAGCNTGGGEAKVSGATITFGPLQLTEMACGEAAMSVERTVTATLSGEVRYSIEAGTLTLDAGGRGLVLRAAG